VRGAAYDRFGNLDVLTVRDDLPEPPVGPDTVLVRVHAAGVNPVDSAIRQGRLAGAYPHHFPIVPGWELSGVVEAVGPAVVDFRPGDEVFGYVRRDDVQWGAMAELVPAPQRCCPSPRRGRCRWPG
jgi:NADPH:quinone reductase-like Zn-dependent oxidoreductase